MITKKQLQETHNLSHNTVTETLKACGLDTARREYSEEEINTLFIPARQMLDEGKTYDDVKAKLAHPEALHPTVAPASAESGGVETTPFAQQITAEIEADARAIIRDALRRVIQYLPAMTQDAYRAGDQVNEIHIVFQNYRQRFLSELPSAESPALPPSEDKTNE